MKAIVCVKQVPDTSGVVAVKADGTMDRAAMDTITNHDDQAAVEAAPKVLKEACSKAEAEDIKAKLEAEGAKVTLK